MFLKRLISRKACFRSLKIIFTCCIMGENTFLIKIKKISVFTLILHILKYGSKDYYKITYDYIIVFVL